MAILTGDQAFCSSCFRCRNCKKKITDLQYARTSRDIFCMSCHEMLLARKRQNNLSNKFTRQPRPESNSQSLLYNNIDLSSYSLMGSHDEFLKEKSLPSLPPINNSSQASQTSSGLPTSNIPAEHSPTGSSRQFSDLTQPQSSNIKPLSQNLDQEHDKYKQQQQQHNVYPVPHTFINVLNSLEVDAANNSTKIAPISQTTQFHSINNDDNSLHKSTTTTTTENQSSSLKQDSIFSTEQQLNNSIDISSSSELGSLQKNLEELVLLDGNTRLSSTSSRAGMYIEDSQESNFLNKKVLGVSETKLVDGGWTIPERSQLRSNSQYRTSLDPNTTSLSTSFPVSRNSNRLRKNSAPIPVENVQNSDFTLEKHGPKQTITSLHQRSISDTNRVSQTASQNCTTKDLLYGEQNRTIADDLVEAKKQIAELYAKLSEPVKKNDQLIFETQKTIAGLETKNEIAVKELQLLEKACVNSNTLKESSIDLVSAFTNEVSQIKSTLKAEIEALVIQRDNLIEKNNQLLQQHEKRLEDIALINVKNNQLLELHKELARQIIEKYGNATKLPQSGPLTKDFMEPSSVTTSIGDTTIVLPSVSDEPMVTILEDNDEKKEKQQVTRRFWKRPTAAVAKGVKGFNKVFSPENTSISTGPSLHSESLATDAQSSTISTNFISNEAGFNTTMPTYLSNSKDLNTRSNSKNNGNGWLKGGADNKESFLMKYPIEKRIQIEKTKIPLIVTRCIQEVEMRGMLFEGLYRKSGARSQITAIEEAFEKTFDIKELDPKVLSGDIAGVTSVVKQYLRYLPIPLIHINSYDNFVSAANIPEPTKAVEELRTVINDLPPAYRDTLQFVICHLVNVAKHSKQNLMTSHNLAVCFAPTIVRHVDGQRELKDLQQRNDGTQLMIDYYSVIFEGHL